MKLVFKKTVKKSQTLKKVANIFIDYFSLLLLFLIH